MNSNEIILSLQKEYGKQKRDIAKIIKTIPQRYSDKMKRGTLRVDELITICDNLGCSIKFFDNETGEEIFVGAIGDGERIRKMIDKKYYDTGKASAISNTFYEDRIHKYTDNIAYELYKDEDGQYFLAKYYEDGSIKNSISLVSDDEAMRFINEHGMELHREADAVIDF